jgi:hypothetical protein
VRRGAGNRCSRRCRNRVIANRLPGGRLPCRRVNGGPRDERRANPCQPRTNHRGHEPGHRVVYRLLTHSSVVPSEICWPHRHHAPPGDGGGPFLLRRPHAGCGRPDCRQPTPITLRASLIIGLSILAALTVPVDPSVRQRRRR